MAENAVYGIRIHNNMQRIKNWRLVLAAMNNYVIRYMRDFLYSCTFCILSKEDALKVGILCNIVVFAEYVPYICEYFYNIERVLLQLRLCGAFYIEFNSTDIVYQTCCCFFFFVSY